MLNQSNGDKSEPWCYFHNELLNYAVRWPGDQNSKFYSSGSRNLLFHDFSCTHFVKIHLDLCLQFPRLNIFIQYSLVKKSFVLVRSHS